MANLAEFTIALTQKDSERSGILEELAKFKETKSKGVESIVLLAVVGAENAEAVGNLTTIDFVPVGADSASSFTAKEPSEVVKIEATAELEFIDITAHFIDTNNNDQASSFSGRLVLSSLPVDLQEKKIEALNVSTHAAIALTLTTSMQSIDTLIAQKIDQLAAKEQELAAIKDQLKVASSQAHTAHDMAKKEKEANKSPKGSSSSSSAVVSRKKSAAISSSPKKSKSKSQQSGSSNKEDVDDDGKVIKKTKGSFSALIAQWLPVMQEYGMMAAGFTIHHRAYFAFAAATVGVFLYGDQFSV